MTKIFLTLLVALSTTGSTFAQPITYEDFKEVIPFLKKEDFKGAYEKSKSLLESTDNDSSDLRGIVTYMNIFSASGMVTLDQMTYDDFEKATNSFVGQYVVMSAHMCVDSTEEGFNLIQFRPNTNGELEGISIIANKDQTHILCFEYFEYSDKIDPSEMIGKNVRCGGILSKIETNPNKSKIWVAKLRIKNAFARTMTPK